MKIVNLVEDTPGECGCGYEHGLSFYIETEKHKVLMDTGASDMFLQNAETLGVDLTKVDTVILSHGHYDHAGGVLSFAGLNPSARIYLKETAGLDYYSMKAEGEKYIGIDKRILELDQCIFVNGNLHLDDELCLFTDITDARYPAKGNLKLKKKLDGDFVQDTFEHEQCLAVAHKDQHILLSGCAHNGILNIVDTYRHLFHNEPDVVISGFHLMQKEGYTEEDVINIRKIADELLKTKSIYYTGHCTGQEAYNIMKEIMGKRLRPIHSGDTLLISKQ